AKRGVVLDPGGDVTSPAKAGRIDENEIGAVEAKRNVDGVAGGSRFGMHDESRLAEKAIGKARFADIGTTHHREPDGLVGFVGGFLRDAACDLVEKIAHFASMLSGNRAW